MITIEKQQNRKPKRTYETANNNSRSQVGSNRPKGYQQSGTTDKHRHSVRNRTESTSSRALYPNTKQPAHHRRQQIQEQQREITARKQLLIKKRKQKKLDDIKRKQTNPVIRKDQSRLRPFDWSVAGIMIYFSLLIGSVCMLLHSLDLAFGWPFHRASIIYDIVFTLGGAILFGMTWRVWRDHERTRKW